MTKVLNIVWVLATAACGFFLTAAGVSAFLGDPSTTYIPLICGGLIFFILTILLASKTHLYSSSVFTGALLVSLIVVGAFVGATSSYTKNGKVIPAWSSDVKAANWLNEVASDVEFMVDVDLLVSDNDAVVRAQLDKLTEFKTTLFSLLSKYANTPISDLPSPALQPLAEQVLVALDLELQLVDKRILQLSTAGSVSTEELKLLLGKHREARAAIAPLFEIAKSNLGVTTNE